MVKFQGCFVWMLIVVAENFNSQKLHSSILKDHAESNKTTQHSYVCDNTWFVWNSQNKTCQCGQSFDGIISCDESTKEVKVLDCYCVTCNSEYKEAVVGSCFFNCGNKSKHDKASVYHPIPSKTHDVNDGVCDYLNRTGNLCGKCKSGLATQAYSYDMKCIPSEQRHLWSYIIVAYLPLTVFIVFILVFKINVVHPKLHLIVLIIQWTCSPVDVSVLKMGSKNLNSFTKKIRDIAIAVYGIWNLDFFRRYIWPDISLNIPTVQILALDYLIAIYPMFLMVIAYIFVELHDQGFRPVLFIWRPFHYLFARFRREWNLQTSIMDAFITFFLLSSTKFINTSFELLIPTELKTAKGQSLGYYLYYDATIKYFGYSHWPYGLLAFVVIVIFVFLPNCLLLFYPLACFQKCLHKCHLRGRILKEFFSKVLQRW